MENSVKIYFSIEQDTDGYPPVAVESVWAKKTATENLFEIDNIPFFTRAATLGDIVSGEYSDGTIWFKSLIRPAQSSLIRVVLYDVSKRPFVIENLINLVCIVERFDQYKLLAISIPNMHLFDDIVKFLDSESKNEVLDYEEAILRGFNEV